LASAQQARPARRPQQDGKNQFEYDVNGNMLPKTLGAGVLTLRRQCTVYDELASASRHSSTDAAAPAFD
jgi:hypothetical protein